MQMQMVFISSENSTETGTHFDCDATAKIGIRSIDYTVHDWELYGCMDVQCLAFRGNIIDFSFQIVNGILSYFMALRALT